MVQCNSNKIIFGYSLHKVLDCNALKLEIFDPVILSTYIYIYIIYHKSWHRDLKFTLIFKPPIHLVIVIPGKIWPPDITARYHRQIKPQDINRYERQTSMSHKTAGHRIGTSGYHVLLEQLKHLEKRMWIVDTVAPRWCCSAKDIYYGN